MSRGYTPEEKLARRLPKIATSLYVRLLGIVPSIDQSWGGIIQYYPCDVVMRDGTKRNRVYLVNARQWLVQWGPLPNEPLGEHVLDVQDVIEVRESISRLLPRFANKLYAAGETGMGYNIFTVHFDDGTSTVHSGGNTVDFIQYPPGKSARHVVDVTPFTRDRAFPPDMELRPEYFWCPFEVDSPEL